MTTTLSTGRVLAEDPRQNKQRIRPARIALHAFLILTALVWLVPLVSAIYVSFRPYGETSRKGIFTVAESLTFKNYTDAFKQGEMAHHYLMTMIVVIPSLVAILTLSSFVAFAVSRFSWRFNIALLLLFTAGNLLPQQVIVQPLFQMYKRIPVPWSSSGNLLDTLLGVGIIHVSFQIGFCTFVLSNYMKTIPKELNEAAMVDGAGVWRQYAQIIMPLCRPALAALATLEFTWIYNDFFWAVVFIQSGDKRPITSSIRNLTGQFFSDDNLVAAGSMLIALPTLIIYLILQKQFISGLTLGASKG